MNSICSQRMDCDLSFAFRNRKCGGRRVWRYQAIRRPGNANRLRRTAQTTSIIAWRDGIYLMIRHNGRMGAVRQGVPQALMTHAHVPEAGIPETAMPEAAAVHAHLPAAALVEEALRRGEGVL